MSTSAAGLTDVRLEGTVGDTFDLQDQTTAYIVGAIAPRLEHAEIERAKHKPTEDLGGYDYYLRAMENLEFGTREAVDEALHLLHKSIERDREYAAAWCHLWRKINGWMNDRARERAEGARLVRRAVELGKDDAVAMLAGGLRKAGLPE